MYVTKSDAFEQHIPKQWNSLVMLYEASLESLRLLDFRNSRVVARCISGIIVRFSDSAPTVEFATSKKRLVFMF